MLSRQAERLGNAEVVNCRNPHPCTKFSVERIDDKDTCQDTCSGEVEAEVF